MRRDGYLCSCGATDAFCRPAAGTLASPENLTLCAYDANNVFCFAAPGALAVQEDPPSAATEPPRPSVSPLPEPWPFQKTLCGRGAIDTFRLPADGALDFPEPPRSQSDTPCPLD